MLGGTLTILSSHPAQLWCIMDNSGFGGRPTGSTYSVATNPFLQANSLGTISLRAT